MRASTTTSLLLASWTLTDAFTMPSKHLATKSISSQSQHFTKLFAENEVKLADEPRTISAKARQKNTIEFKSSDPIKDEPSTAAKTNTVNERLIAELQAAANAEKGPKTKVGEKFKGAFSYSDKSDAERLASLEAAKDLNGVNPTVTIIASFFAFAMAFGLWSLTEYLAALFLSHPPPADAPYAFIRAASVFRNAVMGLISLASGFAGVSGLGVFLLGVRVAYGVMIGELDPTPIKKASDDVEVPNVWDLMMNKKPNRKSRK